MTDSREPTRHKEQPLRRSEKSLTLGRGSGNPRTPTLSVNDGSGQWVALRSGDRAFFVGRDEGMHLRIDHPSISRRHARFWVEDGPSGPTAWVQDLDSRNGTFLLGERLGKAPLEHGDRVLIGDVEVRFDWLDKDDIRYRNELAQRMAAGERDALTGLLLRRAFGEVLPGLLVSADEKGEPISCVLCDLDHFKSINDRFGHIAGDEVLRAAGRIVKGATRKEDLAIRYGGEEIVIVLPGVRRPVARAMAERLRDAMAKEPHPILGGEHVTASFGVAERAPGEPLESWFARADKALYAAKDHGRNRTEAAPPPPKD